MVAQTPAVSELPIRLRTAVSTETAQAGDPIDAVVIAGPYLGWHVRGTVESAARASAADQRASLLLAFRELQNAGKTIAIDGRVAEVDNARESVDAAGCIEGILPSETLSGQLDESIGRLGEKYSGMADVLSAVKNAVLNRGSREIAFDAGVEMALRLASPLPPRTAVAAPKIIGDRTYLALLQSIAGGQPFQTMALQPSKPSDITNLLLIGSEDKVRHAFADAGWALAASLTPRSKFETLLALAEDRGYSQAPVSVLTLDGKPPDLVFEKAADTFARRHHLRIWRRPVKFRGSPVWAAAATHDTGIAFSDGDRTFIHRIDSRIDRERQKVADDLFFAGHLHSAALVARPLVPRESRNATGDSIVTDGAIEVVVLK